MRENTPSLSWREAPHVWELRVEEKRALRVEEKRALPDATSSGKNVNGPNTESASRSCISEPQLVLEPLNSPSSGRSCVGRHVAPWFPHKSVYQNIMQTFYKAPPTPGPTPGLLIKGS